MVTTRPPRPATSPQTGTTPGPATRSTTRRRPDSGHPVPPGGGRPGPATRKTTLAGLSALAGIERFGRTDGAGVPRPTGFALPEPGPVMLAPVSPAHGSRSLSWPLSRSAPSTCALPGAPAGTAAPPTRRARHGGTRNLCRGRAGPRRCSWRPSGAWGRCPPPASATSALACPERGGHRVGLGGVGEVDDGLGQVELRLGQPDELDGPAAASATRRDCGSAMPTSSLASMTRRRAMKRASSPASSIRASQ